MSNQRFSSRNRERELISLLVFYSAAAEMIHTVQWEKTTRKRFCCLFFSHDEKRDRRWRERVYVYTRTERARSDSSWRNIASPFPPIRNCQRSNISRIFSSRGTRENIACKQLSMDTSIKSSRLAMVLFPGGLAPMSKIDPNHPPEIYEVHRYSVDNEYHS